MLEYLVPLARLGQLYGGCCSMQIFSAAFDFSPSHYVRDNGVVASIDQRLNQLTQEGTLMGCT